MPTAYADNIRMADGQLRNAAGALRRVPLLPHPGGEQLALRLDLLLADPLELRRGGRDRHILPRAG